MLTARTEVTDRMLILASGICGRSWPSTRATTTDDAPIAAASSARPNHPVADLSQERIQRRSVLGGLLNGYERAA